jgi:hypothetical protein
MEGGLGGFTGQRLFGSTIEPGFQFAKSIGHIAVLPYSRGRVIGPYGRIAE